MRGSVIGQRLTEGNFSAFANRSPRPVALQPVRRHYSNSHTHDLMRRLTPSIPATQVKMNLTPWLTLNLSTRSFPPRTVGIID
jgi:hypothetical protein